MIKFYLLKRLLVVILVAATMPVLAQTRTVSGVVTSEDDGSTLPGVSVVEKGTSNGTVTDADGKYSINVKDNSILVFSFVGFTSQELSVGATNNLNVSMVTNVTSLDEVVVIGYGEVQKKDATGAVMNLSTRDFNKGVMSSPQDLIVGKFAGVTVTSNNGAPGSGSTIRIRGGASLSASNNPLIVIDGFPIDNTSAGGISNALAAINPNDIETFTVLKDASATAIYGSRASNGVIIITTKKGVSGKPEFSYNGNVSISTPRKYLDVLDGNEFRELATQLAASGKYGINASDLDKLGDANTDWQKEIFRNAVSHDHNLSASGSFKDVPFRISYGYTDQQGILKTTSMQRHSLNLNVTPSLLNDDLKLTLSAKGSIVDSNFGDAGAVGNAISFDPTQTPRDAANADLAPYGGYFSWLSKDITQGNSNPVAMLDQTDNQGTSKRIIGNIQADYRLPFFKDIKATLNLGLDHTSSDGHNRAPLEAGFIHNTGELLGRDNSYSGESTSQLLDFYLNYVKEIDRHKVDVTGGYGWQYFHREGENMTNNVEQSDTTNYENENYLISFFGRLNYTFNGKYILTATLRNDGSSRFAEENRWGLFPAVALAWRVKDEDFLKDVSVLSDLKLRVGYGVTGQQDIGGNYYPALATYRLSNEFAQYQLGDQFYTTLRPQPYNPALKWEETTTLNLGVDFGILDDKITGSVEVFQKETEDLLNYIAIPNGVNFSNFLDSNIGSMRNRGLEVTVNAMPVQEEDFTLNIGMNFTTIDSEITKLTLTDDPTYMGVNVGGIGVDAFIQNHQVGYPASSYFTYQQVYDENGMPLEGLYVDRSGEGGTVYGNQNNKYRYQRPVADYTVGLNARATYKQFDFSFSSRASIGNYVYNNVESGNAYYNNVFTLAHFRNIPAYITDTNFDTQQPYSDYYVQNASFFKMDNISAGYNFSELLDSKIKARLSFTVQNAFVITEYKGIDPEIDGGIDNNIYPRPRTFLLGVNVTF
jgi:TonB-dependent starch-binding outer membrane protein SusC